MTISQAWRQCGEAFERYAATGRHDGMPGTCGYWWKPGSRSDAYERALFCYFMAEAEA